jgi:hypothetical protein
MERGVMSSTEEPAGQSGGSATEPETTEPETGDVRARDGEPEQTDESMESKRRHEEEEGGGAGQGSAGGAV